MNSTYKAGTWIGGGLLLGLLAACTGRIDPTAPAADGTTTGETPVGEQPVAPPPAAEATFGVTSLRRLSRSEYDNTVRDLLGDESSPAASFAADTLGEGGFETGGRITTVEASQYLKAADSLSLTAVRNLSTLVPCDASSQGEVQCAQQLITELGRRAYRRPLTTEEITDLEGLYQTSRDNQFTHETALEFVLSAILQSPNFLYRAEFGIAVEGRPDLRAVTSYELASRLSYFLWNSMPDEPLLADANANTLTSVEARAAHARRLLADPRAQDSLETFTRGWLRILAGSDVQKDPDLFPAFDPGLLGSMQRETDRFMAATVLENNGTFSELLTSRTTYVDESLADLYGVPFPGGDGLAQVELPMDSGRAGILTHPLVLTRNAGPSATSPVRRGLFVREQLLCQPPPPPPKDLNPVPPSASETQSIRDQVEQHSTDPTCAGCHQLLDPLGLTFEGFDAIGARQTEDAGEPIDDSGEIVGTDVDGPVQGAQELAQRLTQSTTAQSCFARQFFRYAFDRNDTKDDATVQALYEQFAASGFNVQELIVSIVSSDAFLYRAVATEGTP